jgi:hypothetical protein
MIRRADQICTALIANSGPSTTGCARRVIIAFGAAAAESAVGVAQ